MNKPNSTNGLEIAVIGMSGRFPGAKNVSEFWNNLENGVESITFFTDEELEEAGVSPALLNNPKYVKANGILQDIEYFDAPFFGYMPMEADIMDPQVRIFHECVWHALEDAAYDPFAYKGLIGLYAGASAHFDWEALCLVSGKNSKVGFFGAQHLSIKDFMTGRISYALDLRGPSFSMTTACSTSLVAIHVACQAVLNGECDIALAGGVTVTILDKTGYMYEEGMVKSPDGHCRAFAADAGGIVGGNGAGVVVLKRLEEALADGDHIYAIIKGSAINNDGKNKVGYSAPSVEEQARVIRAAQQMADVAAETITYVETHGTGTDLGDLVEVEALKLAFNSDKKGFCGLGSVKSNVGHLDSAAGVTGFIKAVLAISHRSIPPSLYCHTPNPKLGLDDSPFYVNTQTREWQTDGFPLRAGVSSFGIGGTNAHVILEEPPEIGSSSPARELNLILLSAKSRPALDRISTDLSGYLRQNPQVDLTDVAYTLQVGRSSFKHRRMMVCADADGAAGALSAAQEKGVQTNLLKSEKRSVVFMFSGQGSQYVNMGLELYWKEPLFAQEIDRGLADIQSLLGFDARAILFPTENEEAAQEKLNDAIFSGPIKFIFEYAMASLLMKWGIKPRAMIGHSFGEYVVACLAGVFSFQDALTLVALRGKLMMATPPGIMLSVPLSEEELKPLLGQDISLAAVNTPSLCIVSGPSEAVAKLEEDLKKKGHECLKVNFPRASHSQMMQPVLKEFYERARQMPFNKPQVPYISGLSGTWITVQQALDHEYWGKHMMQTVRFSQGVQELMKQPGTIFVQVGSDKGLPLFVNHHLPPGSDHLAINMVRHQKEKVSDVDYLLSKLGQLWLNGVAVDWPAFYAGEKRRRLPLPPYSFDRHAFMTAGDPYKMAIDGLGGKSRGERERKIDDWFFVPSWIRVRKPLDQPISGSKPHSWLVFCHDSGFGPRLAERLRQDGQRVVTVKAGQQFRQEGDLAYTVSPAAESDYENLVDQVFRGHPPIDRILHLWGIDHGKPGGLTLETLDRALELGLYSLVGLARALGSRNIDRDLQIGVVTNNMQDVGGETFLCPEKATVLGAVRVIPLEFSNIGCIDIDITLPEPGSEEEGWLISQIPTEFADDTLVRLLAYRGRERWEQTFTPLRLQSPEDAALPLRSKGVYLVTGGLGGIGLEIARYLAKQVEARLVLIGRSVPPDRGEWDKWLAGHDEQDKESMRIRQVRELEALGAEVLLVKADVTDQEQMQDVFTRTKKKFGSLNGVIHAAGIPGGGSIQLKSRQALAGALAAKVPGTVVLHNLLKGADLDFSILFSSGNAFTPIFGQVDYCAANAFLDAYANAGACLGMKPARSINWNRWQGTGMAVEVERKHRENTGHDLTGGITPKQGIEAFKRLLPLSLPQVAVASLDVRIDVEMRKRRVKRPDPGKVAVAEGETGPENFLPRPELSAAYVAPETDREKTFCRLFQDFFGIEKVGVNDDFFELGGDSLKALTMIAHIRKEVDPHISLSELLLHPTIRELSQSVREVTIFDKLECIVKMNEAAGKRNVFIVHPRHGMVYQYKDLAKLLEDEYSVYAIQARGLMKKSKMPPDLRVAAADYIRQMKEIQEEGPYLIVAYCVGDIISYLMINQLEHRNEVVEKFVMLDEYAFVPNPVLTYYRQKEVIDRFKKPLQKVLKIFGQDLPGDSTGPGLEEILAEIDQDGIKDKGGTQVSPEDAETYKARVKQHLGKLITDWEGGSRYKRIDRVIQAPVLHIKARETHFDIVEKDIRRMSMGKVTFVTIPGGHDDIFKSPYVEELAEAIKKGLNKDFR